MKIPLLLLFFFFFYIHPSLVSGVSGASDSDASALLSIKKGIIDPMDRLKDWKVEGNAVENSFIHCNWTGVWCNSDGAVWKLDLSNMNLSGLVSDDIQQLRSLNVLNICCNRFSSSLPKSLSGLTLLMSLDVSQNDFVGAFPVGLGMAKGLKVVNASTNNFSGLLPEDLANATSLEILDFRGSFFVGSIPAAYKSLQSLKFLGLSGNNLTGRIPKELGQLKSLESMILGYNAFEGGIPAEFGNLTNLQYLDLAVGTLSGQIPAELGWLKKLDTIFLYKNDFEGYIPPEIGGCTSLAFLDLSENKLSGDIPAELGELKNLQLLNLMSNNLTGGIPTGLGELTKLEILELWNNSLTGPLPSNLGEKTPLQWLDVSSNSLSGEIPAGLCYGGKLIKLILFNNAISGPIPIGLSTCLSLARVRMQNNFISGRIPSGFGKLENLQRLELANNSLSGEIPGDITSSLSLSFIDLSKNSFQSQLPPSILSIPNLQSFMASDNDLEGQIPHQFQESPSLTMLDLSTNKLSGSIPENFGSSPALEALNLSYNKLEGPLPTNGMLRTINLDDIKGNAGLCGGVLSSCSHGHATVFPREKNVHIKHIIVGWLVGIISLLTIVTTVLFSRRLYKRWYSNSGCFEARFKVETGDWPWRMSAFQRLSFTSSEILACLKESNVIGMGATGIVYKAELHRPHTIVAVKKLWCSQADIETGSTNDLVSEVSLLGRLRHRNIVRLLGYLHNDSDIMIVYEYMRNGSLGEMLHGKQAGKLLIDWVTRYNIAVGVAQGLAYLHHDCNPPVIHRDVKSNNILLDDNLDARIADFGIARMMNHKNETVSMVAGSYGYIAPEYGYTLKVDEKSDIYSYGIVLMELLSGKRPVDPEFGESINIVEWIREKIRNNSGLEESLDPNVGSQCKHVQEEMLLVLRIALLCTAKLPKDRPSMRDVITMLGEAKPRRKSISNSSGNYFSKEKPIFTTSPVAGLL